MHPMRRRQFIAAMQGGASWQAVSAPAGWTWTLPFTIQQNGGTFRVDPTFDLETYAGITVAKTYYVKMASEGGNDSASGADEANALASLKTAMGKVDCDQVMIKAGTYYATTGWDNTSPARSMKIKAYGGAVILSEMVAGLSWSAVDDHYEASYATNLGPVVDFSAPDADGDGVPLVYTDSAAGVDATPGTWFYDATADIIYVRTLDSREPDANIECYTRTNQGRMNDAVTYYVEGISFRGGTNLFLAGIASADAKLYCKNCDFKYGANNSATDGFSVSGLGEVILENCVAARTGGDGFKFALSAAQSANAALINCIGRNNGMVSSIASNGYSRHGPGSTVSINCEYYGNYGPNVRSITDGTLEWLLGCHGHDPAAETQAINFGIGNTSTMWLDTCISEDATVADIQATEAGSTIYYRNMTPATPTTNGSGTMTTY